MLVRTKMQRYFVPAVPALPKALCGLRPLSTAAACWSAPGAAAAKEPANGPGVAQISTPHPISKLREVVPSAPVSDETAAEAAFRIRAAEVRARTRVPIECASPAQLLTFSGRILLKTGRGAGHGGLHSPPGTSQVHNWHHQYWLQHNLEYKSVPAPTVPSAACARAPVTLLLFLPRPLLPDRWILCTASKLCENSSHVATET